MNKPTTPLKSSRDIQSERDPLFETRSLTDYESRRARVNELVATGCFDSEEDATVFLNLLVRESRGEKLVPAHRTLVDSVRQMIEARRLMRRQRDEALARQSEFDSLSADLVRLERALKDEQDRAALLAESVGAGDSQAVEVYIERVARPQYPLFKAIEFADSLTAERDLLKFLNSAVIPQLQRTVEAARERLSAFGARSSIAGHDPAEETRPAVV